MTAFMISRQSAHDIDSVDSYHFSADVVWFWLIPSHLSLVSISTEIFETASITAAP
ncbi:MAG: hypothetical protein QW203_03495 [Thermoplasmatales archaeon]